MTTENNKRIAKNTILLYFRMFLTMAVSLYTSRVVLNTLGIEDFGIYNVVGGVVMMFSFLNSSMASATQRFFSFEIGKNDLEQLKKVFSMSVNTHAIIALFIFLLAETIGLWFLNNKLVIPPERLEAANWVYQFSTFSFMLTVMNVPYDGMIIARERMNVYAYVSIVEVVLKLIIVFVLVWGGFDKLKLYSFLVFCVAAIIWSIYKIYCKRKFTETNYTALWDKVLFKTLMNYAGWNLFGNLAAVTMAQGVNILLNLFFGPVVNAARAIAFQVSSALNGFVSNFQMAINPQIIKSYASDDLKYMHQLIFNGSKYSFYLLFCISLPVLLEMELILGWWLKIVPEYTALFCRLILINIMIDSISGTLMTAAQATGRIKKYQAIIGGLLLFNLPVSYFFLKEGFSPQITIYISIFFAIVALCSRLVILRPLILISPSRFFKEVIVIVIVVALCSIILPLLIRMSMDSGYWRFFVVSFVGGLSTMFSIFFIAFNKQEKRFVINKIVSLIGNNKH